MESSKDEGEDDGDGDKSGKKKDVEEKLTAF